MVQLKLLSGSQAGAVRKVDRFPCTLGRAPGSGVQLEESGVWDRHLTIELDPLEGFLASLHPNALATINGEPFRRQKLRNGDLLELGAVKMQFWLDGAPQRGLRWRESVLWIGLLALVAVEGWLLWRLPP